MDLEDLELPGEAELPEVIEPLYWECPVCGSHQGFDRAECHDCYEGERPEMDEEERAAAQKLQDDYERFMRSLRS